MSEWEAYEERAREFFVALGLEAVRGKTVQGVRTRHKVDGLVEFERFGVRQTWIIECKYWKSRVTKEAVLALQRVVEDVGGDRGFLLSESDFQSGAVAAAKYSNITLSNLGDLRDNAAADLNEHRWNVLLGRHVALWEWNFGLAVPKGSGTVAVSVPADRTQDFLYVVGRLGTLESAFQRSRAGAFPVVYGIGRDDTSLIAQTMEDFLDGAARTLDEVEELIREFRVELGEGT